MRPIRPPAVCVASTLGLSLMPSDCNVGGSPCRALSKLRTRTTATGWGEPGWGSRVGGARGGLAAKPRRPAGCALAPAELPLPPLHDNAAPRRDLPVLCPVPGAGPVLQPPGPRGAELDRLPQKSGSDRCVPVGSPAGGGLLGKPWARNKRKPRWPLSPCPTHVSSLLSACPPCPHVCLMCAPHLPTSPVHITQSPRAVVAL